MPDVVLIQLILLMMGTWLPRSLIQTCTPNIYLYRVTYTRCRIDTINSPDDGHMAAPQSHPNLHTKRSSIQSDIYQMYWCN